MQLTVRIETQIINAIDRAQPRVIESSFCHVFSIRRHQFILHAWFDGSNCSAVQCVMLASISIMSMIYDFFFHKFLFYSFF